MQRWKKVEAEDMPPVLISNSCAIFVCFSRGFKKVFAFLCVGFGVFVNFAQFSAFFAHMLCAIFLDSTFFQCYFVNFFNLCEYVHWLKLSEGYNEEVKP